MDLVIDIILFIIGGVFGYLLAWFIYRGINTPPVIKPSEFTDNVVDLLKQQKLAEEAKRKKIEHSKTQLENELRAIASDLKKQKEDLTVHAKKQTNELINDPSLLLRRIDTILASSARRVESDEDITDER